MDRREERTICQTQKLRNILFHRFKIDLVDYRRERWDRVGGSCGGQRFMSYSYVYTFKLPNSRCNRTEIFLSYRIRTNLYPFFSAQSFLIMSLRFPLN